MDYSRIAGYALYNLREGKLIACYDADTARPVASLTKIMTAIAVLEDTELGLEEAVTITPDMLFDLTDWAVVGLAVGDTLTVRDLLYALMLPSAGDAGQALAIAASGSVAGFADLMNDKASALGLEHTHFSNPIGRDEDNYSTANDIAALLMHSLKNDTFREIFEANEYEMTVVNGGVATSKPIRKTVDLVDTDFTGAKTGFTYDAGRSLASTATRGGVDYLLVALGADWQTTDHVATSATIYDYYGEHYAYHTLLAHGATVLALPVEQSNVSPYDLRASGFEYFIENDYKPDDLTYHFSGVEAITRGAASGDYLGALTVVYEGSEIYREDFYLDQAPDFYQYFWFPIIFALITIPACVFLRLRLRKRWLSFVALGLLVAASVAAIITILPGDPGHQEVDLSLGDDVASVAETPSAEEEPDAPTEPETPEETPVPAPTLSATPSNPTLSWGPLMLINPNFTVTTDWIAARSAQLVDLASTYGVVEANAWNGIPRLDPEAAPHFAEMLADYAAAFPGHSLATMSCFRAVGTSCGRLCYATGTSDHHAGYTCDLIDTAYGNSLDTDLLAYHPEWTWLHENSWKYGFIDRFVEQWAGGPMTMPVNVDENGTTGLYETWHFRYVGVTAAAEIASGKYNDGEYDSLEHYLKATGRISNLLNR